MSKSQPITDGLSQNLQVTDSRREDIDLISQWEECQGHSEAHRLGNVVATIFGRHSHPHRAITNIQSRKDKLRQVEVLWPLTLVHLTLTPIHYLLSTQNQPFHASVDPQTLWVMIEQGVSQQMEFGNGYICLSFGQLFEYTIEFYPFYLIFYKWVGKKWICQWKWWKSDGKGVPPYPKQLRLRWHQEGLSLA